MTICNRCIFDSKIPNITFDDNGICSYCKQIEVLDKEYPCDERGTKTLEELITRMKLAGKNKKYDAVIGVSGGCDSSYLVHRMHEYGLRLLAVHYDNTWNSTIATENIHKVLSKLGIDLFTLVVDNKEADDLFKAFMKAGVTDIECPTDIGYAATLYKAAIKYGIQYQIEGHSFRTEGMCPIGWVYMDGKYIKSIHKQFGSDIKLKTFPNMPFLRMMKWMLINRIKKVRPLYYIDYDKEAAKKLLADKYGWQWYGGHHLENRFTAFYHSYFLPKRWGVDFRIAGYSAYCRNKHMTRDEALKLMQEEPYIEDGLLEYVKKRLGFSDAEFEEIMNLPKKTFRDYKTYKKLFEFLRPIFGVMSKYDLIPRSFYLRYTAK